MVDKPRLNHGYPWLSMVYQPRQNHGCGCTGGPSRGRGLPAPPYQFSYLVNK